MDLIARNKATTDLLDFAQAANLDSFALVFCALVAAFTLRVLKIV